MDGGSPRRVSAAIINYDGGPLLARCLQSILAQGEMVSEIVVVDNRSTDGSLAIARATLPTLHVVELPRNIGYAGAANRAIAETREPYLLVLNPDVTLGAGFVAELVRFAEANPQAGSLTGRLLRASEGVSDRVIDSTGHLLFPSRWVVNRGEDELDTGQYGKPTEVFGVSGAAPLYRRAMLEDVRLEGEVFAEAFFVYLEDVDLDWRARLRGWKAYYVPAAVAHHERGYKGSGRPRDPAILRHSLKNRYLLILRNDAWSDLVRDAWAILPLEVARVLGFLLTAPRSLAGYLDVVRLLPATLRQRRVIRRRIAVPRGALRMWFSRGTLWRRLRSRVGRLRAPLAPTVRGTRP